MLNAGQSKTPQEIIESVRMPDKLESGRFNASGNRDDNGNVFIVQIADTAQIWAVFEKPFGPRQVCAMTFENVPDSGVLDAIVSEWIPGGSGDLGAAFGRADVEKGNVPNVGEPSILLLSRQRAPGAVRVAGLNAFGGEISVAAGLLMTGA